MVLQGSVESNRSSELAALGFICPGLAWLHRLGSVALGSSSRELGVLPAPSCSPTLENGWEKAGRRGGARRE